MPAIAPSIPGSRSVSRPTAFVGPFRRLGGRIWQRRRRPATLAWVWRTRGEADAERRGWPRWLLAVGPMVGLVNAAVYAPLVPLTGFQGGWEPPLSQVATNLLWVPLTPLVVGLVRRLPLDGPRRGRHLVVLLGAALAAPLLIYGAYLALRTGLHAATGWGFYDWRRVPRRLAVGGWLIDVLVFWTIAAVVQLGRWRTELERRAGQASMLEARLARLELDLLKAQLNPHFLFNALHTIASLVRRDPATADRMLGRLGTLLRMSLAGPGPESTLRQEVEYLTAYLEIEAERFRDGMAWRLDVPDSLWEARLPTMLLQPLVENSVHHGGRVAGSGARVAVTALAVGDRLVVRVCDQGCGFPRDVLQGAREGLGLANTRARLRHLYGDEQSVELRNPVGGGATVEITLPLRGPEGTDADPRPDR